MSAIIILHLLYVELVFQNEFFFRQDPPDWTEILSHFRGSELQNYFTKILEDDLKALIKPQYVDQIPKAVKGTVQQLLDKKDECDKQEQICRMLGKSIIFLPLRP